jgi:hypothetical protein
MMEPFEADDIAKIMFVCVYMMLEEIVPPMLGQEAKQRCFQELVKAAQRAYIEQGLKDKLNLQLEYNNLPQSWAIQVKEGQEMEPMPRFNFMPKFG